MNKFKRFKAIPCEHEFERLPGPTDEISSMRVCIKCHELQFWDGFDWIISKAHDVTPYYKMQKIATSLILMGSPLIALLVDSPIGWILYVIAYILMIISGIKLNYRNICIQFAILLFWNVIAILMRI